MRCTICGKPIEIELHFRDLFKYDFYCRDCENKIIPKMTTIPTNDGYLMFYYYYLLDDEYEERVEMKIFTSLFSLLKKSNNTIVIFLDDEIIPYLYFLNFRQNITLFSVKYETLEDFIME